MRLVTRGDLDGLTSAVIITMKEPIDEIALVHPPDSNEKPPEQFKGRYAVAPSAARLVYDYYLERDPDDEKLKSFATLVHETDRLDSAQLTPSDVEDPRGYILLGYTIDSRSGLGAF